MKLPTFNLEKELLSQGYDFVVGIDEAGRGPLAGPVVAAAVCLCKNCHSRESGNLDWIPGQARDDKLFKLIRDSKTLSEKQREELFDFIHEYFYVGIGICDHKTIDRINILEATYLSMKKAVTDLVKKINNQDTRSKDQKNFKLQNSNIKQNPKFEIQNTRYKIPDTKYILLVDGNKIIPNLSMEQRAIVNGDKLVKSISAASIVAKVTRDRIMREMHEKYPHYCFNKHKGYGTKFHMEMIEKYGICPIHRISFEPCKIRRRK